MLDIRFIRNNEEAVKRMLDQRGVRMDINDLLAQDEKWRSLQKESQKLKHNLNAASKRIGEMKRAGADPSKEMEEMREVSRRIKEMDREVETLEEALRSALLLMPNMPHSSVAVGPDSSHNPEIRRWGRPSAFDFKPRSHAEIGEDLGILDFQRGAKIAGSGFTLYRGLGARLERALISFMLDLHTKEHGYEEVLPPFMVNRETMTGTGQLPKFEEDLFKLQGYDYYLIPTAEVPVTNIYRDEILREEDLPKYFVAHTPCFRSEAGSYGKEVRGLIRQHQFNKVELVKIVTPETSYDELESLTGNAEEVLKRLGLHYRVVSLCTGDLGFSASKTYDLEVWLPSLNEFKEISSCSNFEEFQTRRMGLRFKGSGMSKPEYPHSLNGSALAIGRTVVAILENCQQGDGSVRIPDALVPYMDGAELIRRSD